MRYKFNIPHHIKDWCEWQLRYYRESKMQLEQLKNDMIPSATPKYSESIGGSEVSRNTEDIAMRIISSPYIRQLEITVDGITRALSNLDDIDILLINYIYWRKEYTVEGAALKANLSRSAAYKRLNKILGLIAYEIGLIE